MHRRAFLAAGAGALLAALPAGFAAEPSAPRKRIAFLGTVVHRHSHAQHFLDRLAQGYAWGGGWQAPRLEIASVYLDQYPDNDLGRERIEKYRLPQYPSVAEALTLGGSKLAVDGVVIIGEHGQYPRNELGQVLYPRYKWFKEAVQIFERSGRSVPVFNDKHLSTEWPECVEMVSDARRLGFPLHAGSSLPVTWRLPAIDMPYGAQLTESVCVAYGGMDSYDFHAYETAQCMSERRAGGEVGIRSAQTLRGDALWAALASDDRQRTCELFLAALSRSHHLPVDNGYPTEPVSLDWARRTLGATTGIFFEHGDGLRTTAFLTGIRDFNYAGYLADRDQTVSCQMYLPMPPSGATTADFFTPLIRHMEQMILTGREPYPAERTLLTSGMVIGGMRSLQSGGALVETPEMAVKYTAPPESLYWQAARTPSPSDGRGWRDQPPRSRGWRAG